MCAVPVSSVMPDQVELYIVMETFLPTIGLLLVSHKVTLTILFWVTKYNALRKNILVGCCSFTATTVETALDAV